MPKLVVGEMNFLVKKKSMKSAVQKLFDFIDRKYIELLF